MDDAIGIIYFGGLTLSVGVAFLWITLLVRKRRRLQRGVGLDAAAAGLSGRVERAPGREFPCVRFQRGRVACVFEASANLAGNLIVSRIEARLGAPAFLEVRDRRSSWYPTRFPRAYELPFEDRDFRVIATDEDWGSRVLAGGLRQLLAEMRGWARGPVSVQPECWSYLGRCAIFGCGGRAVA